MNSSFLDNTASSTTTNTMAKIIANVVDTQEKLVSQLSAIEGLRVEMRSLAQNMREDVRRIDDRAQKHSDDMRLQHAKEIERLMDVIKTLLAKQDAPSAAEPAPRPTPQQAYNTAQSPASFFGQPQDAQMRQFYMMQEQMRQMQIQQQQQQAANAAANMPQVAPSGGLTTGAPSSVVAAKPTPSAVVAAKPAPSTLQTQLLTPPMPVAGTIKLPISPEVKPKPVEVKKDVVLPAATTTTSSTGLAGLFSKPAAVPSPLAATPTTPKSIFGQVLPAPKVEKKKEEEKKTPVKAEEEEDHVEEYEPQVDFKPVIPLPEIIDVVTGEEDEDVVLEERCKLYRYAETKEWKERGLGNIRVLKNPKTGAHRVVMRREQVHKLCANFKLAKGMTISKMGKNEKAVVWHCFDFAEEEQTHEQFSAKFAAVEQADAFIKAFNDGVASATDATPKKEEQKDAKKDEKKDVKKDEKKEDKAFGADFKLKEGDWECSGCYSRHGGSVATCPCCGTNKDGSPGEKDIFAKSATSTASASSTKFSFGFSKPADNTAAAAPKFSFGIGAKKEEAVVEKVAEKPKFSFGAAAAAAAKEETPTTTPAKPLFGAAASKFSFGTAGSPSSIFGGSKPASTTASPVSFSFKSATPAAETKATVATTSATTTAAPTSRIFGAGLGGSTAVNPFAQAAATATTSIFSEDACKKAQEQFANQKKSLFGGAKKKEAGDADDSDAEGEDYEPQVDFKPVIPLPELVEVKTGEEDEEVLFTHRCKLYRYDSENREWKERGTGDIKILKHPETGKSRVVMRREQVHKLCANFAIVSGINLAPRNGQPAVYQWVSNDFSESQEGETITFSVKFREEATAKKFHDVFVAAQKESQ